MLKSVTYLSHCSAEELNFRRAADRLHSPSLRSTNRLPISKLNIDFTCSLATSGGL